MEPSSSGSHRPSKCDPHRSSDEPGVGAASARAWSKNGVVGPASDWATFLFTDIEGSTTLLRRIGTEEYAEALAEHHRIIREALLAYGGTEITTNGDGFFAMFESPHNCAEAAIRIQRSLVATSWPGGERLSVRMGLHCGAAVRRATTGPVGFDVHRAARVAAAAHGGQIVLSDDAAAAVRDGLPEGASLRDLGLHRLKDLRRREHLFQLEVDGLDTSFPPLRSLADPDFERNLEQGLDALRTEVARGKRGRSRDDRQP